MATQHGVGTQSDDRGGTGLQFRVLGSLEVLDDQGAPVGVRGLRRRALLLRLLIDANRVVPSDALIEDVWSGRPPNDAVGTLQSHISLLRRLLGPRLHSRRPGYLLSVGEEELDARLFEAEVAQARICLEGANAARAASVLLETLDRWRGQPLLDVSGLPWALPTTVHLEQLRFNAIELAAEALLLANRVDEAVALSRSGVEEQPLRERLWTHLMVGLSRQGRQADALRAYQRARSHLSDQLGIEPSPPLLALEDAILMQRPIGAVWQPSATAHNAAVVQVTIEEDEAQDEAEEQPHRELVVASEVSEALDQPERPHARRLVGRDRELDRVQGVLEAARSEGRLRTLVVTGAPGMGRTRFADEVMREAGDRGWEVFAGSFNDDHRDEGPFEALLEGLSTGASDELGHRDRDRALLTAMRIQAECAPLCVAFSEIQHATPDDLATLRDLLAKLHRLPVVVVLCGLGLDFHQNRGVSTLLWRLHRERSSEWIRLEGLRADGLRDLIREIDGTELTPPEAEQLRHLTGGNPMLAVEVFRWDGGRDLPLQELADLYTEQFVAVAGDAAIEAATLVALIGDWVPLELVAELRSKPETQVLEELDAATRVGIIEDDGRGSYRVSVPLVIALLTNRMSEGRRAMLHREIANRLPMFSPEQRPDMSVAVADHWLAGGRGQDVRRVYEAAREAATYALGERDPEQALAWLGIAQRLSEAGAGPSSTDRADLLYELLHTRTTLGYPLSMPLWREAFAAARATGDPALQAKVVLCQPASSWVASEEPLPFPRATIEAAMAALPADETELRARLLAQLAACEQLAWLTEPARRATARRSAVAAAREAVVSLLPSSEPDTVLRVATVASSALYGPTTVGSRAALLRRARRASRRASDAEALADALVMELTTLTEVGDGHGAVAALDRLRQLGVASGAPSAIWRDRMAQTWRAVAIGDCESAIKLLRALRDFDPTPERASSSTTYLLLSSIVLRQCGQIGASLAAVEAIGLVYPGLTSLRAERAACTAWLGDAERAVELVEEALVLSGDAFDGVGWLSGRLFASEVAISAEHHALAGRLVEELRPFDAQLDAGPVQLSRLAGSVPEHLGALLALLGEHTESEEYLRAAIELAQTLRSPYHEARARLRWAAALAARGGAGDDERSRGLADSVLNLAEDQPRWGLRSRAEGLLR